MLSKEALNLFRVLKDNNDQLQIVKALEIFREYLKILSTQICPKGLKINFIHEWIFKNTLKTEKDLNNYCKANLFAADASLDRIIKELRLEGNNPVSIRMITDFVCDLKSFISRFNTNQDYTWLLGNTNTHISNFYYDLSVNVFWRGNPGTHPHEKLVLASSTPFIIRQSIEYKIKRLLGIDYLLLNGSPDIKTIEKCFMALENNKVYYNNLNFDFKTIKQIYSWTNYYVHGGYRPEPWKTETAIDYLKNLFYSGQTSNENSFSLYAGIEVKESDLPNLLKRTEESLKVKGRDFDDIKIMWLNKPEVAIIKK